MKEKTTIIKRLKKEIGHGPYIFEKVQNMSIPSVQSRIKLCKNYQYKNASKTKVNFNLNENRFRLINSVSRFVPVVKINCNVIIEQYFEKFKEIKSSSWEFSEILGHFTLNSVLIDKIFRCRALFSVHSPHKLLPLSDWGKNFQQETFYRLF